MDRSKLRFTKSHEWIYVEDDSVAIIGITDFAQKELGDLVFIEVKEVGDQVSQDENFGTIESVKAVSDLLSPVSGEIVEINQGTVDSPEVINSDPYESGWILKIKLSKPEELDELMTEEKYEEFLASQ